jgi:hypothetical protein
MCFDKEPYKSLVSSHNSFNLSSSYILKAWVADCQRLWSLTNSRARSMVSELRNERLQGCINIHSKVMSIHIACLILKFKKLWLVRMNSTRYPSFEIQFSFIYPSISILPIPIDSKYFAVLRTALPVLLRVLFFEHFKIEALLSNFGNPTS